jgi:hypothetical protein
VKPVGRQRTTGPSRRRRPEDASLARGASEDALSKLGRIAEIVLSSDGDRAHRRPRLEFKELGPREKKAKKAK